MYDQQSNSTIEFEIRTFMKTGGKEAWPGQFGIYKDKVPQRLTFYNTQKVIDIFYTELRKEDSTNPKLSNDTHWAKTRKTIENGFNSAVETWKKENPVWVGTLNY